MSRTFRRMKLSPSKRKKRNKVITKKRLIADIKNECYYTIKNISKWDLAPETEEDKFNLLFKYIHSENYSNNFKPYQKEKKLYHKRVRRDSNNKISKYIEKNIPSFFDEIIDFRSINRKFFY